MSSSSSTWTFTLTQDELNAIVKQIRYDIQRRAIAKLSLVLSAVVLLVVLVSFKSHTVTTPDLGGSTAGLSRLSGTPDHNIGK